MKVVYASRMGKVEAFVSKLGITDTLKITTGDEVVNEDYVLITYTDGAGIVPAVVEKFLKNNNKNLKAVAVSGNKDRHPDTYCMAADVINKQYGTEVLARFQNEGTDADVSLVRKAL